MLKSFGYLVEHFMELMLLLLVLYLPVLGYAMYQGNRADAILIAQMVSNGTTPSDARCAVKGNCTQCQ